MDTLTQAQLIDLEDAIIEKLDALLHRKNIDGSLERMLREMGLDDVIAEFEGAKKPLSTWSDGDVLVLGARPNMVNELRSVGRALGISRDRFEFVEYDDVTNFGFRKLSYSSKYCAVLAGAHPHMARDIEGASSVITHLESNRDEFPETVRLVAGNQLSVTKTNFRQALEDLIARGVIATDGRAA